MAESKDSGQQAEEVIWRGRTHFKMLVKPLFIQLVLLFLHWLIFAFVGSHTNWDWWNAWGPFSLHMVILAIEIWYVVIPILRWWNSTFEVTNKRVVKEWGILDKHAREISLNNIVSISVERSLLDRIFRCGTLVFQDAASPAQPYTRGRVNKAAVEDKYGVRFRDVPNVLAMKKLIDAERYND